MKTPLTTHFVDPALPMYRQFLPRTEDLAWLQAQVADGEGSMATVLETLLLRGGTIAVADYLASLSSRRLGTLDVDLLPPEHPQYRDHAPDLFGFLGNDTPGVPHGEIKTIQQLQMLIDQLGPEEANLRLARKMGTQFFLLNSVEEYERPGAEVYERIRDLIQGWENAVLDLAPLDKLIELKGGE